MAETQVSKPNLLDMPNKDGYFGEYGGQVLPPHLVDIMNEINDSYDRLVKTEAFQTELKQLNSDFIGRPSPIFFARRLTEKIGGARIFFKREDLNHTGAHKINHCLGEALLAKHMGKTKVLAETGAGQHGGKRGSSAEELGSVQVADFFRLFLISCLGDSLCPCRHRVRNPHGRD